MKKIVFLLLETIFLIFIPQLFSEEIFYWKINTDKKVVFLTFDDGPGPWTESILELLKKYNIKATFFVLGKLVPYRKETIKKIVEQQHSIANHTYSHINFYKLEKIKSKEEIKKIFVEEIIKTETEIKSIIPNGYVKYVRFPNGYYRQWMKEPIGKLGYKIVNWTLGYDWHPVSKEEMLKKYISAIQPGGIYLFHDGGKNREKTIFVLEKFIQECLSKGYRFDELKNWIK